MVGGMKNAQRRRRRLPRREVRYDELIAILDRAKIALNSEDHKQLKEAIDTLALLTQEIEAKGTRIDQLRKMLFGSTSEKTRDVLAALDDDNDNDTDTAKTEEADDGKADDGKADGASLSDEGDPEKKKKKKKRKGHGRNGANTYTAANTVQVPHQLLAHKDHCPHCTDGKVYRQVDPSVIVRVTGMAPLSATVYERERLRCHLCGDVFTAESPEGVGEAKYDETATAMIGLLRYGYGLPFNRIEKLCDSLGIPMPSGTQWGLIEEAVEVLEVVWNEIVRLAAQGDVIYIDDTKMKVLDLNAELQEALAKGTGKRIGVFTSGIVSTTDDGEIVLFFTGRNHAGENLEMLLKHRADDLGPPIQMSDALSHNTSGDFETILANCLVHGRRQFVDVGASFPVEVRHVILELRKVYKIDAETKKQAMTADERLRYHKKHSKPVMDDLKEWLKQQFDDKLVEPNSSLGRAIKYMKKHWKPLTLFLRAAGAPLDNNLAEMILKRAIIHRKNSLFYKTENGAHAGDIFMTLIHTAERRGENGFEYLAALLRHPDALETAPEHWLPWNYRDTLAELENAPQPP